MSEPRKARTVTAATRRAKEMMVGGLIGGHVVGLTIIGLALGLGGGGAALTAALGFAAVVIFYSIGQAIEVVASELEPFQGMGLVMISYGVRVVGIAAGLWALLGLPSVAPHVSKGWLLLSVAGTVLAWVIGVVFVASRQHVPVYDREYEPPPTG
ncbi:hypothetical protein [Tessaracoccus massiliensis]|uniref:hypothetical protein n=1 Tax=Tessaracoccus massiliensis TaxID=1522311 RepID=UPI00058C4D0F|nr:hypothetical protein [Tessaracoccus massiliensis]